MNEPSNEVLASDCTIDPSALEARRLQIALAGSTLVMVALSWPLWIDLADFPAIPFVRWYPDYPLAWSWLGFSLLVISLSLALTGQLGRLGLALSIPVLTILILGDQLRFQPWVYQYLVLAFLIVVLPRYQAFLLCRLFMISMYVYSGVSKLDHSFFHEMGPLFVRTMVRTVGFDTSFLIGPKFAMSLLLMPIAEILIGVLLLFRSTRRIGFVGLIAIHASLLLILGPWGLGHSTIVLFWNIALAYQEYLLFWSSPIEASGPLDCTARFKRVGVGFGLILVLPLGERWGLLDSWPSHALYASHCERSRIVLDSHFSVPDAMRGGEFWSNSNGDFQLNLTAWSRAIRGVPIYPQCRYINGVAEWLALQKPELPSLPSVTVIHSRRAELMSGYRLTRDARGLEAIRDEGDRFWFNAHPRAVPKK